MKILRSVFLVVSLFVAATASASPVALSPGAYQLVCAHDDGPSAAGQGELSVRRVQVLARGPQLMIAVDGITAVIRTDEFGGFLFTWPVNEGVEGTAAAQVVYVGSARPREGSPLRVEGFYRLLWSSGEEKGRFALIRDEERNG